MTEGCREQVGEDHLPIGDKTAKKATAVGLDDVLVKVGDFGRFQRRVVFLIGFVAFSTAFNNLGYAFWAARPGYQCKAATTAALLMLAAARNLSITNDQLLDWTVPWEANPVTVTANTSVGGKRSQCKEYSYHLSSSLNQSHDNDVIQWLSRNGSAPLTTHDASRSIVLCTSWAYDTDIYKSTIVTQWDLVCERRWLASATQAVYMAGRIAGTIIYGYVSDRFGRRTALLLAISLQVLCSISCAVVPNVYAFLVLRFLLGIQTTGEFQCAYVIAMEMVGPSWRVFSGTILQLYWSVAYMCIAVIAYLLRERTALQLAFSIPLVMLFPIVYRFIPETPRWLFANGRQDDCERMLKHIALVNGKTVKEDQQLLYNLQEEERASSVTMVSLFRTKNIRKATLLLFYIWFVNSFVFYGLSLGAGMLFGGNQYLSFFLSGLVEVPAHIACLFIFQRYGRPLPFSISMLLAGASLIAVGFTPADMTWLRVILGLAGKTMITASYAIVYLYTTEVYPTVMRGIGVGGGAMMARFGGVVAPFAAELGIFWTPLPMIVFGGLALLAGCVVFFLPETKGQSLPQTVEDGERLMASTCNINLCFNRFADYQYHLLFNA